MVRFTMNRKLVIKDYINLIDCIKLAHDKHNRDIFRDKSFKKINLKRKTIKDLYCEELIIKSSYRNYINTYLKNANLLIREIDKYCYKNNILSQSRIKTMQSIYDKVIRKIENSDGTYPINKYLNDLVGFRVIDYDIDYKLEKLKRYLKSKNRFNIKVHNKSTYIGYHLYYKGYDNFCFPIELQVWDFKDFKSNMESHAIYKSSYKKDINSYKDF